MKICPVCAKHSTLDATTCMWCHAPLPATPPLEPLFIGAPSTNGKAIGSLICGIFFFFPPTAIAAVILGHKALREIRRSNGGQTGHGLATAGSILGYLGSSIGVLIIVAIAVPNLLRSKMAANEAAAVASLRTYDYALATYLRNCPQIGFPESLETLGPGKGDCQRAQLLDSSLAGRNPVRSGYTFRYSRSRLGTMGNVIGFSITAVPVTPGSTGVRYFYTDETGIIRWSNAGPANGKSSAL